MTETERKKAAYAQHVADVCNAASQVVADWEYFDRSAKELKTMNSAIHELSRRLDVVFGDFEKSAGA